MSGAARTVAIVLAAGASERFGSDKLLAPLDGRPLLQHVLDAATASSVDDVIVVVGHAADAVLAAVRLGRARAVVNPDHALGQSTSLRAGLRAAAGADAGVVLLGDQPRVTAALVDALIERWRVSRSPAVVSSRGGRRSPPAIIGRELWPAIDDLTGDVGARELLVGREGVAVLDVTPALGSLDDVDRPADLARIARKDPLL